MGDSYDRAVSRIAVAQVAQSVVSHNAQFESARNSAIEALADLLALCAPRSAIMASSAAHPCRA